MSSVSCWLALFSDKATHYAAAAALCYHKNQFVKTLDNWPHLIRLGDQSDLEEDFPGSRGGAVRSLSDGSDKPGVHTKYKPFLSKDKSFAKIISSSKVS